MKLHSGIAAAMVLTFTAVGLTACDKGPAQKAGQSIDNAAKKTGEKIDETVDKAKDAVKR